MTDGTADDAHLAGSRTATAETATQRTIPPFRADANTAGRLLAAALVCSAAVLLFGIHARPVGYLPLVLGVALAIAIEARMGAGYRLSRDLGLIALGQLIVSTISLKADLTDAGMLRFTIALSLAVLIPWAISTFAFRDRAIVFPVLTGRRWNRTQWIYLGLVLLIGYLILPIYFIGSGAYQNWPDLEGSNDIARLFVGVNAVGLWDELFFICVIFALLREHFPMWIANFLQAIVFVSFLWELGYREWGPLLTIPFALVQGWIFSKTKSLSYVVAVHLLFDAVVFAVLVHAHHPDMFDIFITAP